MGSSAMNPSPLRLGLAAVAALLVAVPAAIASYHPEGQTPQQERKAYTAAVERICKSNRQANSRILKGVERMVKRGRLVPAGRRFIRASNVFGRTVRKIARVQRPPTFATQIRRWISNLKRERSLLRKIGKALRAKRERQARRLGARLDSIVKQSNNRMVSFEFRHCRFEATEFL